VTRAQSAFAEARPEIAELLQTAKSLPDEVSPQRRMSPQENQLRQVVVALIAMLQAYVTELLEEKADELSETWADLSEVQRRYVSVQARRRIGLVLEACKEVELADSQRVASFRTTVLECAEWHERPSLLARSVYRVKLDGFLQDNGANTLDRTLSRYGKCGMSFFNWLSKYYPSFRGIEDTLNILIATRNDVAHGTFERRVTIRDTRLYRALIYRLIGKIEVYVEAEQAPSNIQGIAVFAADSQPPTGD
jgi:hypothetical protein